MTRFVVDAGTALRLVAEDAQVPEAHGLRNAPLLEDTDVATLTRTFRTDGWDVAEEGLVIGFDGSGNPLVVTNDGPVVTSDHDTGERYVLAETFADLLDQNVPDLAPPEGER